MKIPLNPADVFASMLVDAVRPKLAALLPLVRDVVLESYVVGFARLALEYQPPEKVAATLRQLAEDVEGR